MGPCRVELQGEAPRLRELTGVSCCGYKLPTGATSRVGPQGKAKLTSPGGCGEQGLPGAGPMPGRGSRMVGESQLAEAPGADPTAREGEEGRGSPGLSNPSPTPLPGRRENGPGLKHSEDFREARMVYRGSMCGNLRPRIPLPRTGDEDSSSQTQESLSVVLPRLGAGTTANAAVVHCG